MRHGAWLRRSGRRHIRFLIAFGTGLLAALLVPKGGLASRLLIGSDLFFATFLAAIALHIPHVTSDTLRYSPDEDEGISLIVALALAAIGTSLFAILRITSDPVPGAVLTPALALVSVPLGWAVLHTVLAFHYAGLWYGRDDSTACAPLDFGPATARPGIWDFLYYSFTIGMTAQTADVDLRSTRMRRATVLHGIVSFFYNTVILALAVNVAAGLGG